MSVYTLRSRRAISTLPSIEMSGDVRESGVVAIMISQMPVNFIFKTVPRVRYHKAFG